MKKNMFTFTIAAVSLSVFCVPAAASENNSNTNAAEEQTVVLAQNQYQLKQKVYKKIKGWWTNESAGTCDWKITQKKIKIYSRSTGECIQKMRIYGCKKVEDGYIIKVKNKDGQKFAYSFNKNQNTMCNYQDSDHDGICDNYQRGRGGQYQDDNNNGVCDNYENRDCCGNGSARNGHGYRRCAR